MLYHWDVRTIAHRPDNAQDQMVEMSALLWIWWSGDCWRVVGGHICVLSGLHCCETSGCSSALHRTVLFLHLLLSFTSTFGSFPVAFSMEPSIASFGSSWWYFSANESFGWRCLFVHSTRTLQGWSKDSESHNSADGEFVALGTLLFPGCTVGWRELQSQRFRA